MLSSSPSLCSRGGEAQAETWVRQGCTAFPRTGEPRLQQDGEILKCKDGAGADVEQPA